MSMNANGGGGGGESSAPFMDKSSRAQVVKKVEHHVFNSNVSTSNNVIQNTVKSKNKRMSIAERRAAKCGFNASNINVTRFGTTTSLPVIVSPPIRSPYFTVPPGISPSVLLESPIMLPNAQAQLSPTTGTFPFPFPSPNHESLNIKLKIGATVDNSIVAAETPSSTSKAPHEGVSHSNLSNNSRTEHYKPIEEFEYHERKGSCFADALAQSTNAVLGSTKPMQGTDTKTSASARNQMLTDDSPKVNKKGNLPKEGAGGAKYSEDGYYWRKYGQKQVKGSEYPRSYFKCTNTSCPVKKKVERSHDGQITEIVYKGSHNHPKPHLASLTNKRINSDNHESEILMSANDHQGMSVTSNGLIVLSDGGSDRTSSTSFLSDFSDPISRSLEPAGRESSTQEFSSTFGGQDCDDHRDTEASPESISINDEDDDDINGDQCEPKKRKKESFPSEACTISRSTREPRIIVQIESDVDILDDGYRWRKYGQKVVKGNPNPRSYYKCTTPGCPVRKHVERAATDIKCIIITYEGKHNHPIPSTKNGTTSDHVPNATNPALISPRASQIKQPHPPKTATIGNKLAHQNLIYNMHERKPILNYNELSMLRRSSNLTTPNINFLGANSSNMYPFPPFPSMPPYNTSFLMSTGNHMTKAAYPSSYPTLPDYMPSMNIHHQNIHPVGSSATAVSNNYQFNSYAAVQSSIQGQLVDNNMKEKILKPPKEEQIRDDGGNELYDRECLSFPNQGNING